MINRFADLGRDADDTKFAGCLAGEARGGKIGLPG